MTLTDFINLAVVTLVSVPALLLLYAVANACCDVLEDFSKERRA